MPRRGNAGGALAAYTARCGLQASVIMPENSPQANLTEGFLVAPEAAAAYSGYKRLREENFLERNESVVVFLTGSGYKYLDQFGSWSVE